MEFSLQMFPFGKSRRPMRKPVSWIVAVLVFILVFLGTQIGMAALRFEPLSLGALGGTAFVVARVYGTIWVAGTLGRLVGGEFSKITERVTQPPPDISLPEVVLPSPQPALSLPEIVHPSPPPVVPLLVSPDDIEIIPEYERVIEEIKRGTPAIFVTGRAGTGKSTMIRFLLGKIHNGAVVAPTGLAALNVGGVTIHSFFSFPPITLNSEQDYPVSRRMAPVFQNLGVLIVDEVSMVTPDMIDCMDASLRRVRRINLPFGGVPVVFVGDLHQLEPVVSNPQAAYFFTHRYRSPFFFDADIFHDVDIVPIALTRVFRQDDEDFVRLLDQVRRGRNIDQAVETLNGACLYRANDSPSLFLVPTNGAAGAINTNELNALPAPLRTFNAIIKGQFKVGEDRTPAPDKLELKVGARVLFVKNNRPYWVNGTLGEVLAIEEEIIRVRIDKTESVVSVQRVSWEQIRNQYDPVERRIKSEVVGSFTQFPLTLGWALTIHKCQGMTLDSIRIDIGNGAFAAGQTYVALSRCKTLEGISLDAELLPKDIIVSEEVRVFYSSLHERVKRAAENS